VKTSAAAPEHHGIHRQSCREFQRYGESGAQILTKECERPGFAVASALRMYTEEEVSGILQVSLSQLRKWRMKEQAGKQLGPPFKKVGRLVRYPHRALQAYIDGE